MNIARFIALAPLLLSLLFGCIENMPIRHVLVNSPSTNIRVELFSNPEGNLIYKVFHNNQLLIDESQLGFEFTDMPDLRDEMIIVDTSYQNYDGVWELPWGEKKQVVDRYRQMNVWIKELKAPGRMMNIIFRVYDDGIGFRYSFPEQANMQTASISNEITQFKLTSDPTTWWIPGDWDSYEHLYNKTRLSEINAISKRNHGNLGQTYIPENAVNTPVTMRTDKGIHVAIHEANLTDYAGMTLKVDTVGLFFQSSLVGSDNAYKVVRDLPFETPWRTIQIAEQATGLLESDLILNLNEPNSLEDVSWIKPMKYLGIWWQMHIGIYSWHNKGSDHGATTDHTKKLIDFAADNGFGGVLAEGWNTGWGERVAYEDKEGVFDFVTPSFDFDLRQVAEYGKEKGVQLIMHHETNSAPRFYEQQLDTAFSLMQSLGLHTVKSGYVGKILPKGEHHHGQWMVNHYRKVVETAAKYQVAMNVHEPIKDTGIRRTYPNMLSREGLRGQEFNAWSVEGGNPPEHIPSVVFTRMLGGPIDYTPGIFNLTLKPHRSSNRVQTTLAHQLALYVVLYSPVQMAPDLINYYEGHPAFQFVRDVAVDWEETKVLNGEVGDYVTIARKERSSDRWFIGSVTDENARTLAIDLDFLDPEVQYKMTIYTDGEAADFDVNPTDYLIDSYIVNATSGLTLTLARGGGCAIHLEPATAEDMANLRRWL
ncbi:MAG: glycoside hydrolase family 97 protein [Reichenbachiella sp.]|uniref:glycoside hydrolase family 97 protein n=1 Tax=Reichenbachiella sp. TaxID=2184521 RepID=UPI00326545F3